MNYVQVELKQYKFTAYFFDGTEKSAREFCRKWGCNYVEDFMDKALTSIVFPDGKKCYAKNYVVIDGKRFTSYTREEFTQKFKIVPNYRQGNQTFLLED